MAVGLVGALALGACTSSAEPKDTEGTRETRSPPTSTAPATPPGAAQVETPEVGSLRQRCGHPVPGRTFVIPGDDRETGLVAAELGAGPDVAVMVHQVGSSALCGWVPYAAWAAEQGVRLVLVDACGYGESVCSQEVNDDAAAWLGSTVDWARDHGARRVTLVGASMGGSIVAATAPEVDVDAVVDLSGPAEWAGVAPLRRAAPRIDVPFLAAAWPGDDGISASALRRATEVSPGEPSRFVRTSSGHGWGMLTASGWITDLEDTRPTGLGRLVVAWIRGEWE